MTTSDFPYALGGAPAIADFAIVDLALDANLHGWIYELMDIAPVEWEGLYLGTNHHAQWTSGPVLLGINRHKGLTQALAERFATRPVGMLIAAPGVSLFEMAEHFRQCVFANVNGKPSIFRFYEPRSLTALFSVLEPGQQRQLFGSSERWSWHCGQHWMSIENDRSQISTMTPVSLSEEQMQKLAVLKQRALADSLHEHYRRHLPAEDTFGFVQQQLAAAQLAGLSRVADYERWIRLGIMLNGPVEASPQWLAATEDKTLKPGQILDRLENEQG